LLKKAYLLIAVILFAAFVVSAQTYSVPGELNIDPAVERTFPDYFGHEYPHLIPERFFPIGWSRDGKFAYYTEPADEACGCYFAHLVIQDLRTDKIVWEFKYQGEEASDISEDIETLWAKNKELFSEKLRENKIVQTAKFKMRGKTFLADGKTFKAIANITEGENPGYDDKRVDKISLSLSNSRIGNKVIYSSEDHSAEEYWFMLDADVIGVLESPFEKRVAIVMAEVMRGYEGPPHTTDLRIVGADLTSGFLRTK